MSISYSLRFALPTIVPDTRARQPVVLREVTKCWLPRSLMLCPPVGLACPNPNKPRNRFTPGY